MAKKQVPLTGELVKKSNAIARARWKPESVWEPRIVALVASKVREDDEDFFTYRIPVAELTGGKEKNLDGPTYKKISESIAHLGKATLRIQGNRPNYFRQYNIFAMCGYEEGYLVAGFHPDLKPHFLNLKSQFTAYNLFEYLVLPSTYSQRFFEILKSWSDKSEVTISLIDLHETLNTPESYRSNFKEFRRWVLEKAYKDIHKGTKLLYEWEPIKKGRAVESIMFYFGKKGIELKDTKEKINKKKEQEEKNKNLVLAIECAKEKALTDGICKKQNNKRKICVLCKQFDIVNDILKHNQKD